MVLYESSILGGFLIIAGLYVVTWAAYREKHGAIGMIHHSTRSAEQLIHQDSTLDKIPHQIGTMFSGPSTSIPKIVD